MSISRLLAHPTLVKPRGPVVLCIMDGVGLGLGEEDDAVVMARTPNLDRLRETCPFMALQAHGTAVGLPSDSDMGNSEVGHNAIGCGRVFDQGAKLVDQAIESGDAWETEVWKSLIACKTLHLIGLVSDGNVHSHVDHLNALISRAQVEEVSRLRVHVLTDGRDVGKRSALTWVRPLEERLAELSSAHGIDYSVGSGGGRMFVTMDRYEANWAVVERGWRCHVEGIGRHFPTACEAIETLYSEDAKCDDQYLPAFVVVDDADEPVGRIQDGDGVLFINFRGDRAIEISKAFEYDDASFDAFDRGSVPDVYYAGIMQYDGDLLLPKNFLVPPPAINRTLGEFLCSAGLRTFAVSETQKFGHVTYFFNGNRSGYIDESLEKYVEVPSDVVPFDQRPWMKAAEVTDEAISAVLSGDYDHVRLNLANGDMVGHTGILESTKIALEAVDLCVGRLEQAVRSTGGVMIITADHGNSDQMHMRNKAGEVMHDAGSGEVTPLMSHTLNAVPCILVDPEEKRGLIEPIIDTAQVTGVAIPAERGIASLGPSVLQLLGLQPPEDYVEGLVVLKEEEGGE